MPSRIEPVPCLRDNYAYLIQDGPSGAWVVDPSESSPIRVALEKRAWSLAGILATHHHPDHVGGIAELVEQLGPCPVLGHSRDEGRIPRMTQGVDAPPDRYIQTGLKIAGLPLEARHIPGHTRAAIAWKLGDDIFTGDTLFAAGCGRLFEGTPEQMHRSLQALCEGPEHARLWFGHEYTRANLRFAIHAEPDNAAARKRLALLEAPGAALRTTPTTVGAERETNPFVRSTDAKVLGERRTLKDAF